MPTMRLPGKWHYESCITECGCKIVTATRDGILVGEEFYCEFHKRIEKVSMVNPATLAQQDAILRVDGDTGRQNHQVPQIIRYDET